MNMRTFRLSRAAIKTGSTEGLQGSSNQNSGYCRAIQRRPVGSCGRVPEGGVVVRTAENAKDASEEKIDKAAGLICSIRRTVYFHDLGRGESASDVSRWDQ